DAGSLRRLFRRGTSRASVEEDFPRAIRLSYPCRSKGADLRSRFIENGTAGESQIASGVCYDALGLPAERCDRGFEEFRPARDHFLLSVHSVAPSKKLSVVGEVQKELFRVAVCERFGE